MAHRIQLEVALEAASVKKTGRFGPYSLLTAFEILQN